MAYKLAVDRKIFDAFPGYQAAIVYASDLVNGPSSAQSVAWLRDAEREARDRFDRDSYKDEPHIRAWADAFVKFGVKKGKYPASVESLLKRVASGKDLPPINALVDAYNAVSLHDLIPVGGEDRDRLASDLTLRFMAGTEAFDTVNSGVPVVEHADAGEVAWCDAQGVTCRRWNWRQCRRTALTEGTRNAYFVLDRLPPYPEDRLLAAAADLEQRILRLSPSAKITHEVLRG
ncbi:MAG TPA: phenylalanine--tRNA ligase beta subunit-related protein [Xanthobacteraceae bacterium]|nr:phenylalanine--tRNA ligase beta subunit-related protein [Xanthobacteraceae bacterium]